MSAKAPKKTAAQKELERLQVQQLREQERLGNVDANRAVLEAMAIRSGQRGMALFMRPQASGQAGGQPTAQLNGTTLDANLTEPATVAAERMDRLNTMAVGFGSNAVNAIRLLKGTTRI